MNAVNRIVKNTFFLYAKMGITILISLYTTRIVLNTLGVSDFGIFNIVGGAIAMLGFLNASMASATQRFMSYSEGEGNHLKKNEIFNISFISHLILSIVVAIVLIFAGYFFFNGVLNINPDKILDAKIIFGTLIISTIFGIITVPYDAVLNARENMQYYSVVGIVESLLKLGVAIIVVYSSSNNKLILYGILMSIIPIITFSIMSIYCHKSYAECKFSTTHYKNTSLFKEMTSFAGWSLLGNSSGAIYGYGANILLNNFFGTKLNAANGICNQLNGQLMAFSNNMLKAVNPIIVKSEGSGNRNYMYQTTFTACKFSTIIYSIFAVPFLIESSTILNIWLKNPPPFTHIFLKLLIAQMLIEQISIPLGTSISAIGKIKIFNIINSSILYISIFVLYFLFKHGYPSYTLRSLAVLVAFIQTGYRIIFSNIFASMPLYEYLKTTIYKTVIVIIIPFIAVYFIHLNMQESILRLIIIYLIYTIQLIPTLYLFGLTKNEKETTKKLIKSIYSRILYINKKQFK